MIVDDEELYKQTLAQYNDPAFARQYADNIAHIMSEWMFDQFLQYVSKGGKVLDIACAAGRDSAYLNDKGYKVTGIDYSVELINIARQSISDVEFVQGDFTKLPFEGSSFDAIWCKAALVHLPSQAAVLTALREFYRVLKTGGSIMINTKARLAGQLETAIKKDALSAKDRYFRYQTEEELSLLCKQAGFKIIVHKLFNEKDDPINPVKRDQNWLFLLAKKER